VRAVRLKWVDSAGHEEGLGGWAKFSDVQRAVEHHGTLLCFSTAWLVHETDDSLTIATTYTVDEAEPDLVNGCMTIPKLAILEREDLG
jgi:hypothetical protein